MLKATTKQVNHIQNRLTEIKGNSETSTETYTTRRNVESEEKLIGLLNNETAQVRGFLSGIFGGCVMDYFFLPLLH